MQKRRKPINWFRIIALLLLIVAAIYFERTVVPTIPIPGVATPTATRNPESYITEAEQLFAAGKLAQSADAYQSALLALPGDGASYLALARIRVFLGEYADAQISAENALLLNPNNATAHAVRGWALASQGDFLAGEASIARAFELDPNNVLAHSYYAELLADQYVNGSGPLNVVEKMIEESRIAISLGQGVMEAHSARGYVFYVTGDFENAIREYETAISINSNIANLHLNLGQAYRLQGLYDEAFESLNRANALNPSNPLPDLYISRIYFTNGDYEKAAQYAQQAVNDEPQNSSYHGNLGVILYRNFKWPEALIELSYVVNGGILEDDIEVQPLPLAPDIRTAEYYYIYGFTLLRLDRCGEAIPIFRRIITEIPGNDNAVYNATEGINQCAQNIGGTFTPEPDSEPETATPTP